MKTILFITSSAATLGGVQSRHARLGMLLPSLGWRPIYALTRGSRVHDPGGFRRVFPSLETIELDARTGTREGRMLALRSAIRRIKPDIVVPGDLTDAWDAIRLEKTKRDTLRLVCGIPGIYPDYLALIRRFQPIVDGAYGVSRLAARLLQDVCAIGADRVFHIPTGVQTDTAARPADRPPGPLRLGFIGRLAHEKRVQDLVILSEELSSRGIDYSLRVVGDGPMLEQIRARLRQLRCRFDAPMSNDAIRSEVLPDLDACLLFSEAEGMPNILLEAMAAGVVAVSSDFMGRAEEGLLLHEETALLFPVGDTSAAASMIARLADDEPLRKRVAERARRAILDKHTLLSMGSAFAAMLDCVVSLPPRAGPVETPEHPPSGRLTRLLGPSLSEALRRVARRHYPHHDASEWPRVEGVPVEEEIEVEAIIERVTGRPLRVWRDSRQTDVRRT